MDLNLKTLIQAGTIAGAIAAIGGAAYGSVSFISPFLASEPPPLASKASVERIAQTVQQFQQQQTIINQQTTETQLFLAQAFWSQKLAEAQIELKKHPDNILAQQQSVSAQQTLLHIQAKLDHK